jgi:nitroreductase
MTEDAFRAIVAQAMLAPSAHNTQPARWSLSDGAITVWADLARRLPAGDPDDRDLQVSCGAAVEGTVLALARQGKGATVTWQDGPDRGGLRPIARITQAGAPTPEDVERARLAPQRSTHRVGFAPVPSAALAGLQAPHLTLVQDAREMAWMAPQIDRASARLLRDRAVRQELLAWMRLSPRDARYSCDGLTREALGMGAVTAALTRPALGTPLYSVLARLGLGPALSGEAERSRQGGAILLFHWPKAGAALEAGRAFYRLWLDVTARGLAGCPPITSSTTRCAWASPSERHPGAPAFPWIS